MTADEAPWTRECWRPWEGLHIGAEGRVYPCCVVHGSLLIGDLNEQTLEEIVGGDALVILKQRLLDGNIKNFPCEVCCNAPKGDPKVFQMKVEKRYLEFFADT